MSPKLAVLTFALAALSPAAALAETDRLYVSVVAGAGGSGDHLFAGANLAGATRRIQTPIKDGPLVAVSLGGVVTERDWGRVRIEAEAGLRNSDVRRLVLNDVQRQLLQGEKKVTSTLVNVAYDTPLFWDKVRFSVGAGAGPATIDYDIRYMVTAAGPAIAIPTSVNTVGYQAMAGVQYQLTPKVELLADVRHFELGDHEVERFNQTAGSLDSVLDADYSHTAYTVGVRYRF